MQHWINNLQLNSRGKKSLILKLQNSIKLFIIDCICLLEEVDCLMCLKRIIMLLNISYGTVKQYRSFSRFHVNTSIVFSLNSLYFHNTCHDSGDDVKLLITSFDFECYWIFLFFFFCHNDIINRTFTAKNLLFSILNKSPRRWDLKSMLQRHLSIPNAPTMAIQPFYTALNRSEKDIQVGFYQRFRFFETHKYGFQTLELYLYIFWSFYFGRFILTW